MTTIRASCPTCGDVELTVADVSVRVCAEDNQGSYAFQCPQCLVAVAKAAEPRIVDLLVSSGVHMSVWHLPAELGERRAAGDAISHDDLLDFHELLQAEEWFTELSSVESGRPRPASPPAGDIASAGRRGAVPREQ